MLLKTGVAALLIAAAALASWLVPERPTQTKPDCPGKIVCPITRELVCEDRCPADQDRPDCPGKITCPLTGEKVCKDRCPLAAAGEAATPGVPRGVSDGASASGE